MQQQVSSDSSSQYLKADEFRKYIEVEVLKVIKDLAEKGDTPQEKIQGIARLALDSMQPGMSLEQLFLNAVKLDDRNPELAPVVAKIMQEYEAKYHKKVLGEVSQLIKSGQYDEAQDMVKKVLAFKMQN